MAFSPSLPLTL
jgi:NADPH:quinone reductase-like Zn-dependent oxidoreductase